jgi:DNA-binding NarL/FixJ family response regulator
MGPTRIALVDDQRCFVGALAMLLQTLPGFEVVATATDVGDAETAVARFLPDVLVVDVDVGAVSGLDLTARVRVEHPATQVVVISGHEHVELACAAFRAGAASFITKDAPMHELVEAIRGCVRGESHLAPRLLSGVLRELQRPGVGASTLERHLRNLTAREVEVLHCLEDGLDRPAIARHLCLSVNTVRTHTRNLLAKLEVHSSLEAVALAHRSRECGADVRARVSSDEPVERTA